MDQQNAPAPRKLRLAKETLQRLDRPAEARPISKSCNDPVTCDCSPQCPF